MFRKKLFGKYIEQCCTYCENSEKDSDGDVFCKIEKHSERKGKCKQFKYDPLKRKPLVLPKLPTYNPDDFSL